MEFANNEVYTLVRAPLRHPKMARTKKSEQVVVVVNSFIKNHTLQS